MIFIIYPWNFEGFWWESGGEWWCIKSALMRLWRVGLASNRVSLVGQILDPSSLTDKNIGL